MNKAGAFLCFLLGCSTFASAQMEVPVRHEYDIFQLGFVRPDAGDGGVLLGTAYRRRLLPRVTAGLQLAATLYGDTPDNQLLRIGSIFSLLATSDYYFRSNPSRGAFIGGSTGVLRASYLGFRAGGGNTVDLASQGSTGAAIGAHLGFRTRHLRFTLGYLHTLPREVPGYWSLTLSPTLFR